MEVPEEEEFRTWVDELDCRRDKYLIQTLYLTASRIGELITRRSPSEAQRGLKAYGDKISYYAVHEYDMDILVVKIKVSKRSRHYKLIALPLNEYEPWTINLKYVLTHRDMLSLTRQRIWQILKRSLGMYDPDIHPHSLRHYRLTHLVENYGFDAYDLTVYAGWTFKTGIGQTGQLDTYLHLDWRRYFPKLLRRRVKVEG